jgi:hypothetical protein
MKELTKKILASPWLPLLLIILVAFACYLNSLPNEMFWDDDDFILKNRFIKDWHYFPRFFTDNLVAGGYLVSNYWRPLLLSIFAIEWHLWKDWVYGWHFVSIMIHALAGGMLFLFLKRAFAWPALALMAALLFTAHPVHNEAVVYVNSLGDSLASLFVFSSLFFYTRFRQRNKSPLQSFDYYISLLCYIFALLSKETGIVLVALLISTDFFLLQNHKPFWQRVKSIALSAWPWVIVALIYVALRATVLNFSNSFNFFNEDNAFTTNIFLRLMTFFKAIVQYSGFLFCPYEMRF